MAAPRPLAIVKLGDTLQALRAEHGDFEQWIADGFGPTPLPVVVLDPRRGDTLPPPQSLAGAVLTGSHAMVSDREPWSESTAQWLAQGVAQGLPVLGICYGHQLLADAMGGRAGYHPQGLELGTVEVALTDAAADDPLFQGLPARFPANEVHRQSALQLPPGAVRLAGNGFDPNQAFRIGERAWGVQFHPEFDAEAMRAYVAHLASERPDAQALRDGVAPTAQAAQLLARFAHIAEAREAEDATGH